MGYKVGDEVLLKVTFSRYLKSDAIFDFTGVDGEKHEICPSYKTICKEPEMTAEEAWDIAKKILLYPSQGGYNSGELEEIFGRTEHLWELTPQQAKYKIEAWEAENVINIGDEVDICGDRGIVTSFGTDGDTIHVLYYDGIVNSYRRDRDMKKTGRYIDIGGLLKQIGGDE